MLVAKVFPPRLCQDAGTCRIVRTVDDRPFVPALEARRPNDRGEPARNGIVVDFDFRGVERGNGEGGVLFLMGATERDWKPIEAAVSQNPAARRIPRPAHG